MENKERHLPEKTISSAELKKDFAEHIKGTTSESVLSVKTANEWMDEAKKRPIPKQLMDEFWIEGEVCILFADTNVGKSILAVQVGNCISKGIPLIPFEIGTKPQKVLYCDFEMSDKQFENRYSREFKNHYSFDDNFLRAELDLTKDIPKEYQNLEAYILNTIEENILKEGIKVIIVDNISYLVTEMEKSKRATPLMHELKKICREHNVSILVLAHTPKRDVTRPIGQNDIADSKSLINFADSCFGIGMSAKEEGIRYLKQIKVRNAALQYGSSNVAVCQLVKPDNFLQFEFIEFDDEENHLKRLSREELNELDQKIVELKEKDPNRSIRDIAKQLETNHMRVKRVLERSKIAI